MTRPATQPRFARRATVAALAFAFAAAAGLTRPRARTAGEALAQVQPRARPEGAVPRRLHELGQARRGAHQGRSEDRGVPQRAARQGRGHHRADPPGREHRPEHRLRAPGQLRARHRGDERPVLRRDAGGGRQAAQGAHACSSGRRSSHRSTACKVVCFNWVQGYRHFFTNKPVRTPEDLKGQRIRTPPAPIWQESIRALGASPVAMAFGEMYPGLQQKAIDGVELVYNNIPGGRFYEVLKYANETRHIMLINFEVVSAKWFDTLPANYQTVLVEECERGRRGDVARRSCGSRARSSSSCKAARHDDRRGRRPRGLPQGRRQGLRGAEAHRRQERACTRRSASSDRLSGRRGDARRHAPLRGAPARGGVHRRHVPRAMVLLIFTGGVARMLGHPLNWTTDVATCLFAWACFLCADIAWRRNGLMAVELVTARLSPPGAARAAPRQPRDHLAVPRST